MGTGKQDWANYHLNIQLQVDEIAAIGRSGPRMLGASGQMLKHLLGELAARHKQLGVIGSGWSLSSLLGSEDCMLRTDDLDGIAMAAAQDLDPGSTLDHGRCVFVAGGAKCQQLSYFAELRGLSLPTCGSYLEQSVAGAIATGVIGSRLGHGGVQNMVRGVQLVTSDSRSVWVEPSSKPALSSSAAQAIADEVIRDDAVFAGALVHLGGMGLVGGYLVELEPNMLHRVMRLRKRVDASWIKLLESGNFRQIAADLGEDADPAYYEVQIDPFEPFSSKALHTMYFVNSAPAHSISPPPHLERSLDGIAAMAMPSAGFQIASTDVGPLPPLPSDIFEHYSDTYFQPTKCNRPTGNMSWGEIHAGQAAKELRGLIYTSAFAVERARLGEVIEACAKTYSRLQQAGKARHMLFTLRFVTNAAGAMAFTHFPESVVVDMEGISISPDSPILGQAATKCLRDAGIPYAMHWGKLQEPDAVEVEAVYGPSSKVDSRISLWRKARKHLVTDSTFSELLANDGLYNWGLFK